MGVEHNWKQVMRYCSFNDKKPYGLIGMQWWQAQERNRLYLLHWDDQSLCLHWEPTNSGLLRVEFLLRLFIRSAFFIPCTNFLFSILLSALDKIVKYAVRGELSAKVTAVRDAWKAEEWIYEDWWSLTLELSCSSTSSSMCLATSRVQYKAQCFCFAFSDRSLCLLLG